MARSMYILFWEHFQKEAHDCVSHQKKSTLNLVYIFLARYKIKVRPYLHITYILYLNGILNEQKSYKFCYDRVAGLFPPLRLSKFIDSESNML